MKKKYSFRNNNICLIRIKYLLIIMILFIGIISSCSKSFDESKNLLINGSFEIKKETLPESWQIEAYDIENRNVNFSQILSINANSGDYYIKIENKDPADSRFIQKVNVKPKSYYKLTGWIKAQGADNKQVEE